MRRNLRIAGGGLAAVLLAAAIAAAVLIGSSGGGSDTATPTPSPTPEEPTEAPTPSPAPPATSFRLLYRESGATEDVIWRVSPADISQREQMVKLPHREGFPVLASVSPDGRMLAYLALPEAAQGAETSQAEAFVYDFARQESTKIAGGIDYQFKPLWSPDGQLLYLRRYAGFNILSSDVTIIYTRIVRLPAPGEPTTVPTKRPTPTPTLPPGETATPTPAPVDPIKVALTAKYSQVQEFIPLGFDNEKGALIFVQVNGGLQGVTLLGSYSPATTEALAKAAEEAAKATPSPTPTPVPDPPPAPTTTPTPTPQAKLLLQLTDQAAEDFGLSMDVRRIAFRASSLVEGRFVNRAYFGDVVPGGGVHPVPLDSLPPGDHAGPLWHPDGRLAVAVLPSPGFVGVIALISLDGAPLSYLPAPEQGFDVPRSFSPDGVWLAVSRFSGESLVNPGDIALDLVAPSGHRLTLGEGEGFATADAIVGWVRVLPSAPAPTPGP